MEVRLIRPILMLQRTSDSSGGLVLKHPLEAVDSVSFKLLVLSVSFKLLVLSKPEALYPRVLPPSALFASSFGITPKVD